MWLEAALDLWLDTGPQNIYPIRRDDGWDKLKFVFEKLKVAPS